MRKMLSYGLVFNLAILLIGNFLAIWNGNYGLGFLLTGITALIYLGIMYLSKYVEES